jgi:hypothetical protein
MTWYLAGVILVLMLVLHIVEDFHIQGLLGKMKCKDWWEEAVKPYEEKTNVEQYNKDWIVALCWHAFGWSFCITLPFLVWFFLFNPELFGWYFILLGFNSVLHGIIDHLKCNLYKINLNIDQLLHIIQIIVTWVVFLVVI